MGGDGDRSQRMETRLTSIETMLKEIKDQLGSVSKKVVKIENRVAEQGNKIEKIEEICRECINLREETNAIKAENVYLKQKVKEIQRQMEIQQIKDKRRELEIHGIPRTDNENHMNIIKEIARLVKVTVADKDIEECYRRKDFEKRVMPIRVKFRGEMIRDKFIKEAKKAKITLGQIGIAPENKKVYVNEALIPIRKKLLYMAKREGREKQWLAIWTFRGDIYIKRRENEGPIKIENEEELILLTGNIE